MEGKIIRPGGGLLVSTIIALCSLAACQQDAVHRADFFVFGTDVEVELRGVNDGHAETLFRVLGAQFQQMHDEWHAWEPGQLTELNAALAAGEPADANPRLIQLIRTARGFEDRSGGLFNPAIGGLVGLWGFHTSEYPVTGPPPSDAAIDAWVQRRPSLLDVRIDGRTITSHNTAVQLDFGGIGKGFAVDEAIDILRRNGVVSAIVNAGGDLRVLNGDGDDPYRIGIRHPARRDQVLGGILAMDGEAVFTSGNSARYREDAGERWPHIIDPRDGRPVSDVASVTVIADQGALADAAATSLMVAGLDEWPDVAAAMGLTRVLVVDESGRLWATPAMRDRLVLEPAQTERLVVVLLNGDRERSLALEHAGFESGDF